MKLEDLGYSAELDKYKKEHDLDSFDACRVIVEHKEKYIVKCEKTEYEAEMIGRLRYAAQSREDYPAVGDWVACSAYDEGKAFIHAVFPRKSVISRKAPGKYAEKQIIAANIDCALIVSSVDENFNINRIERYLAICNASKIEPVIVLSKIDLIGKDDLEQKIEMIRSRIAGVKIVALSSENKSGFDQLKTLIQKGQTCCLLGSSGAGKSTLINTLSGKEIMKTAEISLRHKKGRHTTTSRELIVLEEGGILIDNPGMREVGISDVGDGLEITFDAVEKLSEKCRYNDCRHINEKGCAVIEAVEKNEISRASYENYLKMKREKLHFEASAAQKRKTDKDFGKMVKKVMKEKKKLRNR